MADQGSKASNYAMRFLFKSFLVISVVTASAGGTSAQTNDWVTFRNTEFKFRFLYPPDWTVVAPRGPNIRASVNGPPGALLNCNVLARLNPEIARLSRKEISAELTRQYTLKDWQVLYDDKFPDLAVLETRSTKIDNQPAQFGVLRFSYETPRNTVLLQQAVVFTLHKSMLWTVSCGAGGLTAEDAARSFQAWRVTLLAVLSTFVFEY